MLRTVLKVFLIIVAVSAAVTLGLFVLQLFGVAVGAVFSVLGVLLRAFGSLLSVALRLGTNPLVLILLVIFFATRRSRTSTL